MRGAASGRTYGIRNRNVSAANRLAVLDRSLNWLQPGSTDVEPAPPALRPFFNSAPNPVTDLATLRFTLPAAGAVSLRVFGPDGRLVQTLVDASLAAGTHAIDWNRSADDGQRLPARCDASRAGPPWARPRVLGPRLSDQDDLPRLRPARHREAAVVGAAGDPSPGVVAPIPGKRAGT